MGTNHDPQDEGDDRMIDSGSSSLSSSDMESDFESSDEEGDAPANVEKDEEVKKEEEGLDQEDPVIKAIMKAKEKKVSSHPPDLVLETIPSTISFHPQEDQVVFGNYEGQVILYGYSNEQNIKLATAVHKDQAVRSLAFSVDGKLLISAFSDQTIKVYDVANSLSVERTIKNATPASVSSVYVIDENVFATGDDDGNVLLWDNRAKDSVTAKLRLGEDAITSMISNDDRRILVCTSEEGAIYAVKIRGGKVQVESEIYDYEFNCSCVFKQESKLAVGDGKGDVYIFNWDEFGKHSDICKGIGKGEAIQAMIPITERILLCGGDDGFIRAYHFFPHKYLGVVGKVGHPVEKMDVCNDGHLIASLGADETVKFWNVSYFENMTISETSSKEAKKETNADNGNKNSVQKDLTRNNLPSSSHQNAADFFKGLADD